MFRNALFNPSNNTPSSALSPRRFSHYDVSMSPRMAYRRATMPVIDVSGMSPGLGYMKTERTGPSTPCFVTPTLGAFSGRRFSFDSPLQTLTAMSSAGLPTINRKAAKRAWAKMSPKRMSRPWKMFMILLLISFAVTLFLFRKSKEIAVPVPLQDVDPALCNEESGICEAFEAHYHENNPKEEFMGLVSPTEHSHLEEPSDLWVNRWALPDEEINDETTESESLAIPNELEVNVVEQEPLELENLQKEMSYVESVKSFIRETLASQSPESWDQPKSVEDSPLDKSVVTKDQPEPVEDPTSEQSILNNLPEESLQVVEQELQAQIISEQMHPGSLHHPAAPQPPAGHFNVPEPDLRQMPPPPGPIQPFPSHVQGHAPQQQLYHMQPGMNGMPPPPPGHQNPQGNAFPPPARLQQQSHMQYSQGLPPPRHGVPPGINPGRYNPQYPQPPSHHNQGHRIGHNPSPNVYQGNHDQKLPPGVNPHRYGGH